MSRRAQAVTTDGEVSGAALRRRERQLRMHWRHEHLSLRMLVAYLGQHSRQIKATVDVQTVAVPDFFQMSEGGSVVVQEGEAVVWTSLCFLWNVFPRGLRFLVFLPKRSFLKNACSSVLMIAVSVLVFLFIVLLTGLWTPFRSFLKNESNNLLLSDVSTLPLFLQNVLLRGVLLLMWSS